MEEVNRNQSCVAAPWLSSANLMPTRIECLRNFSAHLRTQVSSCFCRDLCLNVSTQSLKHLSTSELYILRLQWNINLNQDPILYQAKAQLNKQLLCQGWQCYPSSSNKQSSLLRCGPKHLHFNISEKINRKNLKIHNLFFSCWREV